MPIFEGLYYVLTEDQYSAIQALGGDFLDFLGLFTQGQDNDGTTIWYASTGSIEQTEIMILMDEDIIVPTWRYTRSTQWEIGL